jgi:hypothetical protein
MLAEVQAASGAGPASSGGTAVRTPPPSPKALDRAASLSGHLLDSRYQVLKKLGEGGMSYVYLAKEVSTGQEVAIKVLSPKLASDKSSVARLRRRRPGSRCGSITPTCAASCGWGSPRTA